MNRGLTVYGVIVIVAHLALSLAAIDPFADGVDGETVAASARGPDGPLFAPSAVFGGK